MDTGARWGGEEMLVLFSGSDAARARVAAERIRAAVADCRAPDLPPVTLSGGVAEWQADEPLEATIKRADEQLYQAKAAGRDRVA
jgi:diguanylate cyclase (GGDEF)-like protein